MSCLNLGSCFLSFIRNWVVTGPDEAIDLLRGTKLLAGTERFFFFKKDGP